MAYGGLINGMDFGNWFRTKYLRLRLLHHPFALREFMSLHCSALSTGHIKATVRSIRYFNWRKCQVAF